MEPDSDADLVPDRDEILLGTDPNNPDTDCDGILDGNDLSPLINPVEPTLQDLQAKGMIRLRQPVYLVGLDGWVVRRGLWGKGDPETYNEQGTKKSTMDAAHYTTATNKAFENSTFVTERLENKTGSDFTVSTTAELTADKKSEWNQIWASGFTTPNEYDFRYDYLTDFQLASLKNSEPLHYPSDTDYFRYLYYPVKLAPNKDLRIEFQFKDPTMYADLNYQSDTSYKIPVFMYTFYTSADTDLEGNEGFIQDRMAIPGIQSAGLFRMRLGVSLLGALILTLTIAGCGGGAPAATSGSGGAGPTPVTAKGTVCLKYSVAAAR